ncbi:MAG: hypothetical protein JXR58_04030 [Bacteroidales bacterium]|nr:hypothetical protein [Bacteroidales bacterium]
MKNKLRKMAINRISVVLFISFFSLLSMGFGQTNRIDYSQKTIYPIYNNDAFNYVPENILRNIVYSSCNGILIMEIKKPESGEFSVSVKNQNNITILSDTIISNGKDIIKTYDLSEMADKKVTITVKHGDKISIQSRII